MGDNLDPIFMFAKDPSGGVVIVDLKVKVTPNEFIFLNEKGIIENVPLSFDGTKQMFGDWFWAILDPVARTVTQAPHGRPTPDPKADLRVEEQVESWVSTYDKLTAQAQVIIDEAKKAVKSDDVDSLRQLVTALEKIKDRKIDHGIVPTEPQGYKNNLIAQKYYKPSVATVTLYNPSDPKRRAKMKVGYDNGAQISMISPSLVSRLGLQAIPGEEVLMTGATSDSSRYSKVHVGIEFAPGIAEVEQAIVNPEMPRLTFGFDLLMSMGVYNWAIEQGVFKHEN